jgi:hypothetical protein
MRDRFLRIKQIFRQGQLFNDYEFSPEQGDEILNFMDANKGLMLNQRNFLDPLQRCDRVEEQLNNIEGMCLELKKDIIYTDETKEYLELLKSDLQKREEIEKKGSHTLFTEIEEQVTTRHKIIKELHTNHRMLTDKKYQACEFYNLLKDLLPVFPADLGTYQSAHDETDVNLTKFSVVQYFYLC